MRVRWRGGASLTHFFFIKKAIKFFFIEVNPPSKIFTKLVNKNAIKAQKGVPSIPQIGKKPCGASDWTFKLCAPMLPTIVYFFLGLKKISCWQKTVWSRPVDMLMATWSESKSSKTKNKSTKINSTLLDGTKF
jgi:hypothetical protein